MPRFLALLVLLASTALAATEPTKTIPLVALADGRVLKNVTLANFKSDTVLLRHTGGALALRYEFLPDGLREQAEAQRPGGARAPGAAPSKPIEVKGQVYVQTQGAGAYKFGNVKVYAFPSEAFSAWDTNINPVQLPRPLAITTTDGDGRFTLSIPADKPYFIFAQASRLISTAHWGHHEWRVPAGEVKKGEVMLSNEGAVAQRPVKIEGEP